MIGYYVHHHGVGHLTRASSIVPHLHDDVLADDEDDDSVPFIEDEDDDNFEDEIVKPGNDDD